MDTTQVVYELVRLDGTYEELTLNEGLSPDDLQTIKASVEQIRSDAASDQEDFETNFNLADDFANAEIDASGKIELKVLRVWIKGEIKADWGGIKCRDVYKECYLVISYNKNIEADVLQSIKDCALLGTAAAAVALGATLNIAAGWGAFQAAWWPCIKAKVSSDVYNALNIKLKVRTIKSRWKWCT